MGKTQSKIGKKAKAKCAAHTNDGLMTGNHWTSGWSLIRTDFIVYQIAEMKMTLACFCRLSENVDKIPDLIWHPKSRNPINNAL